MAKAEKTKDGQNVAISYDARRLMQTIAADGEASVKGKAGLQAELESRGLIRVKKGKATLTKAGRWAAQAEMGK